MRVPVPELEQQGAFEQEVLSLVGNRKPVQQTFEAVAREDQVEVLLRCIRVLLQSRTDRGGAVGGHAVIASM
jgi:hypothetical protein